MPLRFKDLSSTSVREVIAQGLLPELEYGLLKKHGERLRWSTADRSLFCSMVIDVVEASQDNVKLQCVVRSFCHARDVVSDHLQQNERFNTKRCILLIGDVGMVPAPWANLMQAALYLHAHGFNVINIEVPEFAYSTARYLKYGPAIFSGLAKHMNVSNICTLACGNGGALFFETIAQYPATFGPNHFVFNLDCPPGTKKAPFPLVRLEDHLREANLQFWFGFNDEEGVYSRFDAGTPRKSYEAVTGMQVRLEGERKRGRRSLDYDEVLTTEALGGSPKAPNVKRLVIGKNNCVVCSDALLESLWRFFFAHQPTQTQDNMVNGLVPDMKLLGMLKEGEELPELPALQALRLGNGDAVFAMKDEEKEKKLPNILQMVPSASAVALPRPGAKPGSPRVRRASSSSGLRKDSNSTPRGGPGMLLQLATTARSRPFRDSFAKGGPSEDDLTLQLRNYFGG
mmetsp:Transcript_46270/g.131405  ORF Transcript_46270/g.131405 Transcript_46270/m.131405 type:complete len:456 (-) Transcript_46270:67-1434(-)